IDAEGRLADAELKFPLQGLPATFSWSASAVEGELPGGASAGIAAVLRTTAAWFTDSLPAGAPEDPRVRAVLGAILAALREPPTAAQSAPEPDMPRPDEAGAAQARIGGLIAAMAASRQFRGWLVDTAAAIGELLIGDERATRQRFEAIAKEGGG